MKNNKSIMIIIFLLFIFGSSISTTIHSNTIQHKDVLSNKNIALKVGELILEGYFGKKMNYCYPLKIHLENSKYWIIEGSIPKEYDGGIPYLKIQKSDCKVIQIYHSK